MWINVLSKDVSLLVTGWYSNPQLSECQVNEPLHHDTVSRDCSIVAKGYTSPVAFGEGSNQERRRVLQS